MKCWTIGAISGGLSGIAGAWLVSGFGWSLISVILIGALIGIVVGTLANLKKGKK